MNNYLIYFHINPLKNEVFYVGIADNKERPYTKKSRNIWWKRTVVKYGWIVDIIEENLSKEEAIRLEKHYIQRIGRKDLGLGTLVNLTDGGEGTTNIVTSDSKREKLSKIHKGKKLSEEHIKRITGLPSPFKGKKHSEESKEKIRIARAKQNLTGIPRTEEVRNKISKGNLGKSKSEEHKLKLSLAHKGKKLSEEHKEKIRKIVTGRKHTEESKNKISASKIGKTKEYYKNINQTQ